MKIMAMSDLHLEMHRDEGAEFIDSLDTSGVDVLVLAGDITLARHYASMLATFKRFQQKIESIVYVPGNHEFYNSSPEVVFRNMERLQEDLFPHFRVLARNGVATMPEVRKSEGGGTTIKGQRFIGGTMWFPESPDTVTYRPWLNDFRLIKDFVPWVHDQNTAFRFFLEGAYRPDDVVITHFLPSPESTGERFKGDPLNCYFLSDMTDFIVRRQPKLWIHGHTHLQCDYKIGNTRVVANPLGYPSELEFQQAFQPRFIIEV